MISEADVARHVSSEAFGAMIEAIATAGPQHFSVRRG